MKVETIGYPYVEKGKIKIAESARESNLKGRIPLVVKPLIVYTA